MTNNSRHGAIDITQDKEPSVTVLTKHSIQN